MKSNVIIIFLFNSNGKLVKGWRKRTNIAEDCFLEPSSLRLNFLMPDTCSLLTYLLFFFIIILCYILVTKAIYF